MEKKKLEAIYEFLSNDPEYSAALSENLLDIDWLKDRVSMEEYRKLEETIFNYASKNDKRVFIMGFQYAWELFHECMKTGGEDIAAISGSCYNGI